MKIQFPKPTGQFAVGTFTYTIKDHRKEVLPAGGMRSIAARVYYPCTKESVEGLTKVQALSPNMIKGFKASFHVAPDFTKNPEDNLSECYTDAPCIPGQKFPLVIFNHGYNSYREGNSLLCIELASHGYVVISVAHSYEALCSEFDDGSWLLSDKKNTKLYDPMLGGLFAMYKIIKSKAGDQELAQMFDQAQRKYCKYMIGRLPEWIIDNEAALDYAKKNLSDLIDFSKGVGATGHSFGGNTAYAFCARNPDFICGINIDGALFGDYSNDTQTKPFMQISCQDNEKAAARVYLKHSKPVYKVLFKDMKHIGFADSKYTMPMKSVVGKLAPDLADNDVIKVKEYSPDLK